MDPLVRRMDGLPSDVLDEIFEHCIPSDPLKQKQPDPKQAPMLLCHVCSSWRAVALQNPYIWTHLYHVAFLKPVVGEFDQRDITFLRWWIEKTKGLAPSIRLEFKKDDKSTVSVSKDAGHDSADFVKTLVQFMGRARYLNLDFHYNHLLRTLFGERPLSCPNLDTLIMRQGFGHKRRFANQYVVVPESGEGYDTERYIPVTPKQHLRRLLIQDIVISVKDVHLTLNWAGITHMHANINILHDGWFKLLRECVSLVFASFKIHFTDAIDFELVYPLKTLPNLRQLTFQNFGDNLVQSFLANIHLPSLTCLRMDCFMSPSIERLHQILSSTPVLQELQLAMAITSEYPNSILIPGDLEPVTTSLRSVVPDLRLIHFEGSNSMLNICTQDCDVIMSVLTGDWLQLGRPGSRITRVQLGVAWDQNCVAKIMRLVRDLQASKPEGVTLALRPHDAPLLWQSWDSQYNHFTDRFEDLRFDEVL